MFGSSVWVSLLRCDCRAEGVVYVNVEAEDGCSSVVVNGSCNCESIAACAGSRSEVSMSANETVVGIAVGAV